MRAFLRLLPFCLLSAFAPPIQAQTADEIASVFAGPYRIYDAAFNSGGPCTLSLSRRPVAEALLAEQAYCRGGLENVAAWGVDQGQLVLLDQGLSPIARLGGGQQRISGEMTDGRMVILERTRPGDTEPRVPECLYAGYGQDCADAAARAPMTPAPGASTPATLLVDLRFREQPRDDATVVSTGTRGTCVAFEECRTASDGPWCRTTIQGVTAWAKRHALRLDRYPVLTYGPGC